MPFCPECRDEFQDWVRVCPDCNVALVDELPPLPEEPPAEKLPPLYRKDEPLVHIATAPNEMVAAMWSGMLEEQGFHCLVKRDCPSGPRYQTAYNRCGVYVLALDAERAKEIITPFLDEEGVEDISRGGR